MLLGSLNFEFPSIPLTWLIAHHWINCVNALCNNIAESETGTALPSCRIVSLQEP